MSNRSNDIEVKLYTMCVVRDGDRILLMNRPNEKGFPGWIAAGGKVEFPESLTEGAIREVKEETGLTVSNLIYKGLDEFVDPNKRYRYMVFNYITDSFEGELRNDPPEGELQWVSLGELNDYPMQDWFRERLTYFFEDGTFEIYALWDEDKQDTQKQTITKL
ncbi:8-oxo-dGTP diphosphatase [Paenibacillus sp. Marseille-Q4541]|uniref:8-oxo-dGTP diphosphatase n=1 Tax=Paenibacillus sp. Marseille-Q4541 TaxID=2831522 RepID=UPI001BA8BEEC|nr:8-oxo-dGTP diphosphatase [Paenibacillus sp. Marseille-Q4541]